MKTTTIILSAAAALAVAACKQNEAAGGGAAPAPAGNLEAVLTAEAPPNPVSILEARKNPAAGADVTVTGKIMGRREPFVDGRALVVIGDPAALTSCDLRPGDSCATPWDVCCDEPAVIRKSIATVQVVDADGSPLKEGLKGLGGMKELSSLVVTGTVAEGSNADNFVINATGIHVAKAE
ncbi:MAG: hypothetical protein HKN82_04785 [Akkermansiaceae bacterium]|nr:hypothetical protein [Akkermansiaceae bacterium]